jgi:hypothetical protein
MDKFINPVTLNAPHHRQKPSESTVFLNRFYYCSSIYVLILWLELCMYAFPTSLMDATCLAGFVVFQFMTLVTFV